MLSALVDQYGVFLGVFFFVLIGFLFFLWKEAWPQYVKWRDDRTKFLKEEQEAARQDARLQVAERQAEWMSHLTSLNQQRLEFSKALSEYSEKQKNSELTYLTSVSDQRIDFERVLKEDRNKQEKVNNSYLLVLSAIHKQMEAQTKQMKLMTEEMEKSNKRERRS
jgi:hypothetical protein